MIVASFKVRNLFGIIDADLVFKHDLSVIVGRNASGKSSVLTLLSNFMHLDYESIKATKFESAVAALIHDNKKITVEARNDDENAFLSIQWGDRVVKTSLAEEFSPRSIRRVTSPSLAAFYSATSAQEVSEALQAWSETSRDFKKLSRLTFVRLDRTVIAINPQGEEAREEAAPSFRIAPPQRTAPKDPIDLVI